jgi:hypothetical protein
MFGRRNVSALETELREVNALISAHPLASQRIRAAGAVVDKRTSRTAAEVDEELAAEGLPSVDELGRAHASGVWSWWKLHRRKMKLEKKLRRVRAR